MSNFKFASVALVLAPLMLVPAAAAQKEQPLVATLSADTPVETLAANPAARAVLEKDVPMLLNHPNYDTIKSLSLRQIQPFSAGALTDPMIAAADADLKALPLK